MTFFCYILCLKPLDLLVFLCFYSIITIKQKRKKKTVSKKKKKINDLSLNDFCSNVTEIRIAMCVRSVPSLLHIWKLHL